MKEEVIIVVECVTVMKLRSAFIIKSSSLEVCQQCLADISQLPDCLVTIHFVYLSAEEGYQGNMLLRFALCSVK